jgi:hypothetical protein
MYIVLDLICTHKDTSKIQVQSVHLYLQSPETRQSLFFCFGNTCSIVIPIMPFLGHICIIRFIDLCGQENILHHKKTIMINPNPAKGPYCLSNSSQFILTAALRYFLLSSLSLWLISPILSKLSPRYSRSSIFLVMTLVTSRNSSFNRSRFAVARESW